jgi:ATP-binding cassette, subfamily D (ALD), peroxisomal long-chain fatty acid import protein
MTPSDLSQFISNYSFKFQYMIYYFNQLYGLLDDISNIFGNSSRVGELIERMKSRDNQKLSNINNKSKVSPQVSANSEANNQNDTLMEASTLSDDICFVANQLSIIIPNQIEKLLIRDFTFTFKKNTNVLVTGRSGCGKTSLLRCICGVWKSYKGELLVTTNEPSNLFMLPQNSYFTSGSLINQIIYPDLIFDKQKCSRGAQIILEWIKNLDLEHILNKVNNDLNWTPEFNWSSILSSGRMIIKKRKN